MYYTKDCYDVLITVIILSSKLVKICVACIIKLLVDT